MFNNKGFTLVEIIITTIIGAFIIVLALGHIMFSAQVAWIGGAREIDLQRDLSLSMDWINRVLRDGERVRILAGGESIEVENLREGWTKRFYRQENNLRVETAGESRLIVDNLMAISFSWGIRDIGIAISLSEHDIEVSAHSATILRNRLLAAEWLFDENIGGTFGDTSPNRNRGTISGAIWGGGKHGSALSFDGNNDYVRVRSDHTLNPGPGISIGAWVNLQPTGHLQTIVDKVVEWQSGYRLAVTGDGRLFVELGTGNGFHQATSTNQINWNTWQAIGFSYDGHQIKFYINGQIDPQVITATGAIIPNHRDLYIGGNPVTDAWAQGTIDEVRIAP